MNFSLPQFRRSQDAFHSFDRRSLREPRLANESAGEEPASLSTLNAALALLEYEDRRVFEVSVQPPGDLPTLQQLVDEVLNGEGKAPPAVIHLPMAEPNGH